MKDMTDGFREIPIVLNGHRCNSRIGRQNTTMVLRAAFASLGVYDGCEDPVVHLVLVVLSFSMTNARHEAGSLPPSVKKYSAE